MNGNFKNGLMIKCKIIGFVKDCDFVKSYQIDLVKCEINDNFDSQYEGKRIFSDGIKEYGLFSLKHKMQRYVKHPIKYYADVCNDLIPIKTVIESNNHIKFEINYNYKNNLFDGYLESLETTDNNEIYWKFMKRVNFI